MACRGARGAQSHLPGQIFASQRCNAVCPLPPTDVSHAGVKVRDFSLSTRSSPETQPILSQDYEKLSPNAFEEKSMANSLKKLRTTKCFVGFRAIARRQIEFARPSFRTNLINSPKTVVLRIQCGFATFHRRFDPRLHNLIY